MHYSYSHVAGRLLQPLQRQDRIPLRRSNGAVCIDDVLSFLFSPPPPAKIRYANVIFELHLSYIMAAVLSSRYVNVSRRRFNSDCYHQLSWNVVSRMY